MTSKRDLSVSLSCAWCGRAFHPWIRPSNIAKYCSRACRSRALLSKINHGDVPDSPMPTRSDALVISGRTVKHQATQSTEVITKQPPEEGREWRQSGEFWDSVAAWWMEHHGSLVKRQRTAEETGEVVYSSASEGRTVY
jgi:hypothetical protein